LAPPENPITPEKAVLGKILFWEEQLSSDDTIACGTCHGVAAGFSDSRFGVHPGADGQLGTPDDLFTSPGVIAAENDGTYRDEATFGLDVQLTGRRTPDIFAALYAPETFWDGRGSDSFTDPETGIVVIPTGGALESQAVGPILNETEMAHQDRDWDEVTSKLATARPMALATDLPPDIAVALAADPGYADLFQDAFGTPAITAQRIAYAIATYERTLVPDQTPWDAFTGGDPFAMTPDQVAGWNQFNGPANCNQCHTPPFFTDNQFHNLGLRPIAEDIGRQEITGNFADRGKFKTPSLRNVGLRERFFHNGQAFALDNGPAPGGVDDIYVAGGGPFMENRDPILVPLGGMPGINIPQLFDFVENALTDPRVANAQPPFDKPTLYSERFPTGAIAFGPSQAGGNGFAPLLVTRTPAMFGNGPFKIGVRQAPTTSTRAILGLSRTAGSGTLVQGVPQNLGGPLAAVQTAILQTDTEGFGYSTFLFALPDNPALAGSSFFAQAFVADPGAPGGVAAASQGAEFVLE
jgi:cytochrome c peroxidase